MPLVLAFLILVQALGLAAIVLQKAPRPGGPYLAAFLVALSLHGLAVASIGPADFRSHPEAMLLSVLSWSCGPLVLRYVRSSFYGGLRPALPFAVHIVPLGVHLLAYSAY